MSEIFYEPHPVTEARKAALRSQGFRIIDEQFKPADYENPLESAPDAKSAKVKAPSAAELKAALDEKAITYKPNASKAELQALLDAAPQA